MTTATADFAFLQELVFERSAIVLTEDKQYLLEARLRPVARDLGLDSVADVLHALRHERDPSIETRVVDAMTTNETSWFRDAHPFEALRLVVLPDRLERNVRRRRLAIWSAACSSGQELYSVAMLLDAEFPQLSAWDVELYGTDLSSEMVERARQGRFSSLEMNRGLPAAKLVRYFSRDGAQHRVSEELRGRVRFERFNLAKPWPPMPAFDVIFLRNVLIYFDEATKRRVLEAAHGQLAAGGYLILGSAESCHGTVDGLVPLTVAGTTIYQAEEP